KDLFEPATIARMVGHLERLLVEATSDPAGRVSRVALLTAHEREALRSWNETRRSRDEDCLHALFERQAARTPDAVAALFEGTVLTYRSLDERANQLA